MLWYRINNGLQVLGEQGEESVTIEFQQMQDNNCYVLDKFEDFTHEDLKKTIPLFSFIKGKHNGMVKTCLCANRSHKHKYTSKEDEASPMTSDYLVISISLIDAKE